MKSAGPVDKTLNPFPATAVAVLGAIGDDVLTVRTSATEQASSFLADYLRRSKGVGSNKASCGSTIAIVGEYGTGKTHLALGLLTTLLQDDTSETHSYYLDAPADTFVALYRDRFVPRLRRRDIRQQIQDYLSELLSAHLRRNPMTAPAAEALDAGTVDPVGLMQSLGLIESDLMSDLRARLKAVTERDDYATAFTLFLRPEFEDAVWEWLCGNPPDMALQERGITTAIDSEPTTLEAIGVFAFLFGRRGHRFVLLIDEMEKVLTLASGRIANEATILAFKKLLEAVGRTRSLLVLIGLPDFIESLPEDARQRLTAQISPSPMTDDEIAQYVREVQRLRHGKAKLEPFTRDAVKYIEEITGGNARKVIRLCYHAYQAVMASGTHITPATLREVAREQFESVPQKDAATEVARILDSNGWRFDRDKRLDDGHVLDFWIPVGSEQAGLIVMLSRSVLHENESQDLIAPLVEWQDRRAELVLSILIVNGYLAENFAGVLKEKFDRILYIGAREFREDFEATARGFRQRLEDATREDALSHVKDRVDQLVRQVAFLVDQVETLQRASGGRHVVESAVREGLHSFFSQLVLPRHSVMASYPATDAVFKRAYDYLQSLRNEVEAEVGRSSAEEVDDLVRSIDRFRTDLDVFLLRPRVGQEERGFLMELERICQEADVTVARAFDAVVERFSPAAVQLGRPETQLFSQLGYEVWRAVRFDAELIK